MSDGLNRREFLWQAGQVAAAGTLASNVALGAKPQATQPASQPAVEWRNRQEGMGYVKLGRTNFMSSRCVFGAGGLYRGGSGDKRLLEIAIERGLNYVDTGRAYPGSEAAIADIARKHREKIFIVSKAGHIGWPDMTIRKGEDAKAARLYTDQLEGSLRDLDVETIDCYMVQGVEHDWIVTMESLYAAFEKARKAGKVRYYGLSTHTNVGEVCELAARTGWYDIIMLAVNPNSLEERSPAIKKMREAGIGTVAMKVSGPIRDNPQIYRERYQGMFAEGELSPYQQAYAYLLFRGRIDAFIAHINNRRILEENLAVPSLKLDQARLDAIEERVLADTRGSCRHCNACTAACPEGLRVADLLRGFAYWQVYDQIDDARSVYTSVGGASICRSGCQMCQEACPEAINLPATVRTLNQAFA